MSERRPALKRIGALATSVVTALTLTLGAAAARADGDIVAQRGYAGLKAPWLVWDQASCQFKPTDKHPDSYSAELRKAGPGNDPTIVYASADTTLPVQKTINGSYLKYAKLSGANMTLLSNEYPSKTKPILLAKQIAGMKPAVVISAIWIPELYTQVGKTYLDACVPFLNMHNMPISYQVPGFQNSFPVTGVALADGVVQLVRQKGWSVDDTWLMVCGTPIIAKGAGTLEDVLTNFIAKVESELKIPKSQQSGILDCKEDAEGARVVATDWLTAHPQAKKVIAVYWNDLIALAMAQALKQKGYTSDTAIAAGGDASDAALEVMTQPGAILQVNADKNFPTWGIIGLSMAQDVAAGRPVPAYVDTGVVAVVGPDAAAKLIAERKQTQ
ncbi:MAG: hypothetical protein U1E53_30945 [Dongiaceae bacterium]